MLVATRRLDLWLQRVGGRRGSLPEQRPVVVRSVVGAGFLGVEGRFR